MPILTPDTGTEIYNGVETTSFQTSVSISPDAVLNETTAEFADATLSVSNPFVSLLVSPSSITVSYDGTCVIPIEYIKYELDGTENTLNTVYNLDDVPSNAQEIIAVKKSPIPLTITLTADWITNVSSGTATYTIVINGNYTIIKDWLLSRLKE